MVIGCYWLLDFELLLFAGIATVYVRYKQVEFLIGEDKLSLHRLNRLGLVFGWISSFGMCVVANFQVSAAGLGSDHTWAVSERVSSKSVCVWAEDNPVLHAPGGGDNDLWDRGSLRPGSIAALAQHAASHPQQDHLPGPCGYRCLDPGQHHQQYPLTRQHLETKSSCDEARVDLHWSQSSLFIEHMVE